MKKNFCKVRRGHCLSLVWIVSFLLWGNVTMAALPIQEAKLSIQQRSVALSRVFYEIEKQTGYSFLVRNNDINMNEKVSIDVKNKSVEEVLEMLFVGKNIRYKVEGEHISVYKPQQSRQNAITGLVMDVAKEPVIGASVVVMGSTNGCITDFDGKFSLEVSEFPVKLQISYIGNNYTRDPTSYHPNRFRHYHSLIILGSHFLNHKYVFEKLRLYSVQSGCPSCFRPSGSYIAHSDKFLKGQDHSILLHL